MKQENFLFVDIVSSIFLLVLMLGNFMGLLYTTNGNYAVSLLASLFVVVCYYFIIQFLKKNKEIIVNKKYMTPQSLFFLVFVFFGTVSFGLMVHTLNIELNFKEKIQKETDDKIANVKTLAEIYNQRSHDDILNYEGNLTKKLNDYKATKSNVLRNELNLEPYNINEEVLSAPAFINVSEIVDAKLKPYRLKIENNKKNIEKTITIPATAYKAKFDNWDRLTLMKDYEGLNDFIGKSYISVNTMLKELPLDKSQITYNSNTKNLPLDKPLELNKIYKADYAIPAIIIILIHLFILIPYFTYKITVGGGSKKQLEQGKIDGGVAI